MNKGIKGAVNQSNFGDDPAYEIGADKDGYAVFKNPDKAFAKMKIYYAKGIAAIKKEYRLGQLSVWNYSLYGTYGWQLRKTEDKEAYDQGFRISKFFDIYENSFE